jgi:hypothetical protein
MTIEMLPANQFSQQQQGAMVSRALQDILRMGLFMAGAGGAVRGARGLWNLGRRNLQPNEPPKLTSRLMDIPVPSEDEEKMASDGTDPLSKYVVNPIRDAFQGNVDDPAGWPFYIPGLTAAAGLGLWGGYKGVDKIMDLRRKQQQQEELEAAKKRYEEALRGKTALSQDLDTLFDMWKQADQIPGGLADNKADSHYTRSELMQGQKVEMEHTDEPGKAKEIAKDHLEESGEYYDELAKMEAGLKEAGLPETYGKALGWGLTMGLPIALISGLATYDLTHKRSPSKVLDKAKQKRRRELAQRRPPALYARPQMMGGSLGASDVPDEDEMAGEPLDKEAAIRARLAKRGINV